VLIQFKEETTVKDFQLITDSAYSLQAIPGVEDLNFGKNVSPEGLGKGFSHSLTMKCLYHLPIQFWYMTFGNKLFSD